MSRPYAEVIGDPIAHSKSPLIHNFWLAKLGIDAEYRICHVRPDELPDYFAQRRDDADWHGCNVTIPHKVAVIEFADEIDSSVETVGAANCLVCKNGKLIAQNTDIYGVDAAMRHAQGQVCIIGAGGAARATFPTLGVLCAYEFRVIARDCAKAAHDLADISATYDLAFFDFDHAEDAMRGVDQVINASPLGMTGKPPMPSSVLNALRVTAPAAEVFDMVYAPVETELLKTANVLGLETVDGLVMLMGQARGAFREFFGRAPGDEHDAELRALLTS
jgi:shikimate dehydrogenase